VEEEVKNVDRALQLAMKEHSGLFDQMRFRREGGKSQQQRDWDQGSKGEGANFSPEVKAADDETPFRF